MRRYGRDIETQLLRDQMALRERPVGRAVMKQRWRSLLFLHFPCPPEVIQRMLPSGLTVDTFPDASGDAMAWVGLVPFRMEGVRPRGMPSIRRLSDFPETNVRTYVHRDGRDPGVWFFSLDAANALACRVARRFFALPYHEAAMSVEERGDDRVYESRRRSGGADVDLRAKFGRPLGAAIPGTLEFFLIERYLLYAHRGGRLHSGRVQHAPYRLREVLEFAGNETLIQAAGIRPRRFTHQIASDGVDVEVFPLRSSGSS